MNHPFVDDPTRHGSCARCGSAHRGSYPVWAYSAAEQRAFPPDLDDIDMDVWRIDGVTRTHEEEMADREEGRMERGWGW